MTVGEPTPFNTVISEEVFAGMNSAAQENYGASLETLASADPYLVYRFLRDSIIQAALEPNSGRSRVNFNSGISVSSEADGTQAVSGAARQLMEVSLPITIEEPIDVVLSVFRKQKKPEQVLSFRVTPSDTSFVD